jgi:hypothetical protein
MDATQAKLPAHLRRTARLLLRVALIVSAAWFVSLLLNRSAGAMRTATEPAGFARGVMHGALMPCAMPALLAGRDLAIYAVDNSGIPYKLGYTAGVNGCGAVFFGFLYWRLNRWRLRQ